ncbi:MAG TPA: sensor histidine kinase [Saprospiraceae bacterium]|nr:sensor histidine kinase [Saprospiraceae bacterium]
MARKCFKEIAGFDDRWMLIIGIPAASVLVSLLLFNDYYEQGQWTLFAICLPMSAAYTSAFWFSLRWLYGRVKIRYPRFGDIGKRLMWLVPLFLLIFGVVNLVLDSLFCYIFPGYKTSPSLLVEFIATMILSALVLAVYEAFGFYLQLERALAEKANLERQNLESQLEGLRNQVNPHFLFNSLNTLIYLIPEDSGRAVRFVQQLSKVYRYVLESREAKVIPLGEELDYLQSYIFLLKERFGDNLRTSLHDLRDRANAGVVPLSLQMLFENAIKHNVISTEKPLIIEVFAENGRLVVRNNLQRKNQVMDSTGVGLDNIRSRYRILTDRSVEVIVSREYFTVLLPVIDLEK